MYKTHAHVVYSALILSHQIPIKGIYYALADGETLDTPGVRLPSVKDFFTDLVELNGIIHSGERLVHPPCTRPTSGCISDVALLLCMLIANAVGADF